MVAFRTDVIVNATMRARYRVFRITFRTSKSSVQIIEKSVEDVEVIGTVWVVIKQHMSVFYWMAGHL